MKTVHFSYTEIKAVSPYSNLLTKYNFQTLLNQEANELLKNTIISSSSSIGDMLFKHNH